MTTPNKKLSSAGKISLLIILCFFFSGLSGLIYEILWTRMIVSVVGGAPFAVATILTIFMGGLGLGAYLASRTIDRIEQPLKLVRLYGILELLIGAYSLVFPLLLLLGKPIYAQLYNLLFEHFVWYNLLTFVITGFLLLVPVTLMGATLPILCKFYVTRLGHLSTHAGRLYGLNTIGAAAGSLLCGFWLINLLGIWGTLAVAVSVNTIIGLVCLMVGYRAKLPKYAYNEAGGEALSLDSQPSRQYRGAIVGALFIFAVSGFCAMAYEVIWTKLLSVIVGPTTYSFTIVLVTFILGLALGSLFFGWLGDRSRNVLKLLIGTQIAAGILALATSQILGGSQMYFAKLIFVYQDNFAVLTLLKGLSLFAFMVLPTLCLGATFPLVGKIYTESISRVGWSIGRAYAVNTIGAVLGSFAAGFILIPQLGKETSLSLITAAQLGTALVVALIVMVKNREKAIRWAVYLMVAVVGVALSFEYPVFDRRMLSLGKTYRVDRISVVLRGDNWLQTLLNGNAILSRIEPGKLLYYGDGVGGFTTVLEGIYQMGDTNLTMANSGKADATNAGDMCTQTLLAHFPMLFHPDARQVMVLGLGSGVTAGEVLHYPVSQVDILEINRQVVAASDFFLRWNNRVLSDPRANVIIQDGRAHLELTNRTYDVIISEPSNPWMAGLASLFTNDFFRLARERLNDDGIFVQFIHSYKMDWPSFALVGRTFASVFPNSILLSTAPSGLGPDYLLVGFKGKSRPQLDIAYKNLSYTQRSDNITLSDPRLFYRLIVAENPSELFGDGPINSEARPWLEFAAPKLIHRLDETIDENIVSRGRFTAMTSDIIGQTISDVDLQIDFAAYAISLHSPFARMVDMERASPAQRQRFFELMDYYLATHSVDLYAFSNDPLRQRWAAVQTQAIAQRIELLSNKALSYAYLADLLMEQGRYEEAADNYIRSLQYDSLNEGVHANLGAAFINQQQINKAIEQFHRALQINPYVPEVYSNLGHAYGLLGDIDKAVEAHRNAVRLEPHSFLTNFNLGLSLLSQTEYDGAIEYLSESLQLNPLFAEGHYRLGLALTQKGQIDEALAHFSEALRIQPDLEGVREAIEKAQFFKQVHGR